MRLSPVLALAAAAALAAGVCVPGTALADPAGAPAAGVATSTVTLLDLTADGRSLSAGTLALLSDTVVAPRTARVVATPLRVDGTAYGEQTVTPADSPKEVPSVSTAGLVPALDGVAGLTSPALRLSADTAGGATSRAGATSLGGASVLGLPLALTGTLDVGSVVNETQGGATKTVEVTDLALPSIADLLAALGLDLSALPVDVLAELVTALDLVPPAVADARAALDAAQAALAGEITAATAEVDEQRAAVDAAASEVSAADRALAAAAQATTAAEQSATALLPAEVTLEEALALTPAEREELSAELQAALTEVTTRRIEQASAQAARAAAQAALEAAQPLLDAAQRALDDPLATLVEELAALEAAVMAVLDGTPLVSMDALRVATAARVTSASAGGQSAEVVGGEIAGLRVLGTDVLAAALGASRVDVLQLTGDTLGRVSSEIGRVTGTLSQVLSTVRALPTLTVPAPQIGLLTKTTSTGTADGFGTAATGVRALSVVVPPITVPDLSLLLSGAALAPAAATSAVPAAATSAVPAAVPAATPAAAPVASSAVSISVGTLTDAVRFRPAVAAAAVGASNPGVSRTVTAAPPSRSLAATGPSAMLAGLGLGLGLLAGAVVLRRRAVLEGVA